MSAERLTTPDLDASVPVAADRSSLVPIWATRCEEHDGELVFGDDVPLQLHVTAETFVASFDSETPEGRHVLKVRTDDRTLLGSTVVMTTWPYCTDWHEEGEFKKRPAGSDTLEDLRRRRLEVLLAEKGDPQAIKGSEHDFGETSRAILTAELNRPRRSALGIATARNVVRRKPGEHPVCRLWGLCSLCDEARRSLELSNEVSHLRRSAENGTLYFQYRGSHSRLQDPPSIAVLYPHVRDKANLVMDYAIDKALAGPLEGDRWRGQAVTGLVAEIFRSTFNNLNKRASRAMRRKRTKRSSRRDEDAKLDDDFFDLVDSAFEVITADVVEGGPLLVEEVALSRLGERSATLRLEGLVLEAALSRCRPVPPRVVQQVHHLSLHDPDASVRGRASYIAAYWASQGH